MPADDFTDRSKAFTKIARIVSASALAVGAAFVAIPEQAAATPNDCTQPGFYRDQSLISRTGTLHHSCSAGTQVTYVIDCYFSDTTVSHYFPRYENWTANIDCGSGGPAIGLLSYSFS